MNTDKLRQMYESGGLLRSILKDPKMRQMAASMLASNTHSVIDGSAGRGGMMKYEDGGMVEMSEQVTEQIGPRYSGKKEWAVSPDGVRWIANEMDKRGIGFRSDEATKTLMEIMKKNPESGLDIIDYAFSAASEYGRNPDSAPDEREYSSDFLPASVPGYRTTVTNGASDYR